MPRFRLCLSGSSLEYDWLLQNIALASVEALVEQKKVPHALVNCAEALEEAYEDYLNWGLRAEEDIFTDGAMIRSLELRAQALLTPLWAFARRLHKHVQKSGARGDVYVEVHDELVSHAVRPTKSGRAGLSYWPFLQSLAMTLAEKQRQTIVYLRTWGLQSAEGPTVRTRELRAYALASPLDGVVECTCLPRSRVQSLNGDNDGVLVQGKAPVVFAQDRRFWLPRG